MEIHDSRYKAVEQAFAETASAVRWAYIHWALEAGIESALKDQMGEEVSKSMVCLPNALEALLKDGSELPTPKLTLHAEDLDHD